MWRNTWLSMLIFERFAGIMIKESSGMSERIDIVEMKGKPLSRTILVIDFSGKLRYIRCAKETVSKPDDDVPKAIII